jgi:glutamate 5-kinase
MSGNRKPVAAHRRIVIKIGSALLVDRASGLKAAWLESLCTDIAELKKTGAEVLVVSSGAIAMGRTVLGLPSGPLRLEESQAAAAVGQIALARAWSSGLSTHGIVAGQILLTLGDTEERRRYLNARATMAELMRHGAVPIINENDTVATSEIRYGDNDRLAARVATMAGADLLVLMSDIDGLYTAPPHLDPDARFLETIDAITPEIEAMAGDAGSELSRGGMKTKIDAGKIATGAGCAMIIASGKADHPLSAIDRGARSSWFQPSGTPQIGTQGLDRRTARAGRQADHRRGRRKGAALRQEPAAGGCQAGCRRLPPRGPGRGLRCVRARDRPWSQCL